MEQTIKAIFFEQVVKAVISKIIIAVPFLGWPVINQLFTKVVYKIASMASEEMEALSIFMKVDFKVGKQKEEYEEATNVLRDALKTPGKTDEEIQGAEDEYREKLRNLIMFDLDAAA